MKKVIDAFGLFYNKNLLGTNCVPLNMPPTTVRQEVQKNLSFFTNTIATQLRILMLPKVKVRKEVDLISEVSNLMVTLKVS